MEEINDILLRVASLPDGEAIVPCDREALQTILKEKPYFTAAAIALLRHCPDMEQSERDRLLECVALEASQRRALAYGRHGDEWAKFYPALPEAEAPCTDDVITTFLNTYGNCSPEEEAQLERLIFNPTPDYAEMLARQEQEELPDEADDGEPESQQARINAFIRKQHPGAHTPEPAPKPEPPQPSAVEEKTEHHSHISRPESSDDSLLSESLAKIFIKQRRYERAYEIISGLSLKFPKKSAYFADQLRFLQKLIINQRQQRANSAGDAQ